MRKTIEQINNLIRKCDEKQRKLAFSECECIFCPLNDYCSELFLEEESEE